MKELKYISINYSSMLSLFIALHLISFMGRQINLVLIL